VKLLGKGSEGFDIPVNIAVSAASRSAIEAIERAGGTIRTVFHDRLSLRATLVPHKFTVLPRPAYPPPKLMARYMDEDKRGYLAYLKGEAQSTSTDAPTEWRDGRDRAAVDGARGQ